MLPPKSFGIVVSFKVPTRLLEVSGEQSSDIIGIVKDIIIVH